MKKKGFSLLLAATMVVGLAACGSTNGGGAASGSQSASSSTSGSAVTSTVIPASSRDATAKLVMMVEGQREELPATLYQGNGYSIYIPDEGWQKENDEDQWDAVDNDDVDIQVQFYPGKTMDEAKQLILRENQDYTFLDGIDAGNFTGTDNEGDITDVRLTETADGIYAVICEYPAIAVEGFGARATAIAETFEAYAS